MTRDLFGLLLIAVCGRAARVPRPAADDAPAKELAADAEADNSEHDAMLAAAASRGRMPRVWPGPPPQVASSSGRRIAVLTDVGLDDALHVLRHTTGPIVDTKFFPQGDRLLTGSYTGSAVIWNATSGESLHTLVDEKAQGGQLFEVQVFPDGDRVATIGENFTANIWSASTGALLQRLGTPRVDEPHRCVRVLPGGARVVTGVSDAHVGADEHGATIWDVKSGKALHRIVQPTGRIRFIEVSPDGRRIVTAGGRSAWVWDSEHGEKVRGPLGGHDDWVTGIAFAEGGKKLVTVGSDGRTIVWDLRSAARKITRTNAPIVGVATAPGGDRMITFSKRHIFVRNTTTSKVLGQLDQAGELQRMTVSASGDIVAGCHSVPWASAGKTVVWNVTSGQMLSFIRDSDDENVTLTSQPVPCSVALGFPRRSDA